MNILFVVSDPSPKSPVLQLAQQTQKRIGREASVLIYDGSPLRTLGKIDGIWIFTHEEKGSCPENIQDFLENNFSAIEDVPATATGVGGKEGARNAALWIQEFLDEHGGRFLSDSDPLCIPLRSSRLDLDQEEKLELIFHVDSFLKYCGMDESDSRKIGFEKVVENYFEILKSLTAEKPDLLSLNEGKLVASFGTVDLSADANSFPSELSDLRGEINELTDDYELDGEEILPALRKKIDSEW